MVGKEGIVYSKDFMRNNVFQKDVVKEDLKVLFCRNRTFCPMHFEVIKTLF